jgi:acyl-lipid (8-3)-desaturase
VCRNGLLCYIAGLTLDAVGASSFMWKQQHVVGHHAYTNVISEDPDIRVKPGGTDVRRVVQQQPRGPHHPFQHVYLGVLYCLLAAKSILIDDFSALATGGIGPVRIAPFAMHEALAFWTGKLLFMSWFLVAPLAWSRWTPYQLFGLWAVALAFCGWTLAFMFQVRH